MCFMHLLQSRRAGARLHRMRRSARGWRCGRRADRRALRRDDRRRPIAAVDAGRAATGDWQRCGCGGTLHLLYVASARVVLYVAFCDLGGRLTAPRLRRRVGVDMGGNATCVRGGCAHAQTQAVLLCSGTRANALAVVPRKRVAGAGESASASRGAARRGRTDVRAAERVLTLLLSACCAITAMDAWPRPAGGRGGPSSIR